MRQRLRCAAFGLLVLAGFTIYPAEAAERVDVLLVLAVDVSLSISQPKFELERNGYAEAFSNPEVLKAIADGPEGRIGVELIEWAGTNQQRVVVDWIGHQLRERHHLASSLAK